MPAEPTGAAPDVLRLGDARCRALRPRLEVLLAGYGMHMCEVPAATPIPGSFWGDAEAGLRGDRLYARPDTPLHSILHEAGHYICMSPARRAGLDTDAGGDDLEEAAVCYLQILLGEGLGVGREHMFSDMDSWGYSFRLGSTRAWFESDATDAREWLTARDVLGAHGRPTGALATHLARPASRAGGPTSRAARQR